MDGYLTQKHPTQVGKYNIGSHDILCDTGFPSRRILCDLHIKKLISQVI